MAILENNSSSKPPNSAALMFSLNKMAALTYGVYVCQVINEVPLPEVDRNLQVKGNSLTDCRLALHLSATSQVISEQVPTCELVTAHTYGNSMQQSLNQLQHETD